MTSRHLTPTRLAAISAVGLLLCATPFTSGCGEEDLATLYPKLALTDAANPERELCVTDENDQVTSCAHGFGDVPIGEGRFLRLWLRNPITVPLTVSRIKIESTDVPPQFILAEMRTVEKPADGAVVLDPGSVTDDAPISILGDRVLEDEAESAYTELVVRFAPRFAASATATLTIVSDAVNVGDGPNAAEPSVPLVVNLTGNGVDLGRAQIRVEPSACHFGQVGIGVAATCEITISNDGTHDLVVDELGFTSATPVATGDGIGGFDPTKHVFGLLTQVFPPTFIAAGTATSIRIFANPEIIGLVTGGLALHSNDPLTANITIPLSVEGAETPTAIATVKSVNNVPNTVASPVVRPLDDVVLTATESRASTANATIVSHFWEIVPPLPTGSTVQLSNPFGQETGFYFNSSGAVRPGLDVAGTYVVKLIVVDSDNRASTNTATVTLNAIPSESLHVQLSWDSPDYDYDLHVVKNNGAYCSPQSCFYANCDTTTGGPIPEWDGVPGATPGDPRLDIDDLSGYGPENINIDVPIDGTYTIGVHAYTPVVVTEVWATVKIYVNGALAAEESREMSNGLSFWEVAEVDWSNGAAIIFPVDTYQTSGWSCSFF